MKKLLKHKSTKGTKGSLLKGMSKALPSEILEDPIFEEKLDELMRGYSGIYALYKGDKLYYVGLTRDLLGRIKWHLRDRHSKRWDYFKIFQIKKFKYLKDIETLIHHIAKTRGNRALGKVPKEGNINHTLREALHEYEKNIKLIKKALK